MPDRRTSVSRDVRGTHHDETALDREESLAAQFERVQRDQEQDAVDKKLAPKKAPERGSRMVREETLAPGMRPAGQMRRVPDKFASDRKLEQERREAGAQNRAAEKAWQRLQGNQRDSKSVEQSNEAPAYGNPRDSEKSLEKPPEKDQLTPEQAWERFQERQREIDHDLDKGRERD